MEGAAQLLQTTALRGLARAGCRLRHLPDTAVIIIIIIIIIIISLPSVTSCLDSSEAGADIEDCSLVSTGEPQYRPLGVGLVNDEELPHLHRLGLHLELRADRGGAGGVGVAELVLLADLSQATEAGLAGRHKRGGRQAGRRRQTGDLSAGHPSQVRGALEGAVSPALPPPPPHQLQPGGSGGEEMT